MSTLQPMRILRPLLFAAAGVAIVVGAGVAVVFTDSFQTWAVRRALAGRPDLGVSVGTVSVGLNRVELRDWRVARDGLILTLPAVAAELPVMTAGMGGAVEVRRLVARGWGLTLAPGAAAGASPGSPAGAEAKVRELFAGVLAGWSLPVALSLDGVELEGEVVLPERRGRTKVRIKGGGFRSGHEGKFAVGLEAALADPRVNTVVASATLTGRMATPRTFAQLSLGFDATAQGTQFPAGAGLAGEVTVTRGTDRENYTVRLTTQTHEILRVAAELPVAAGRVAGTWKLNMRDADVGPFALGFKLPQFAATGEGRFDWELATAGLQVSGLLNATAAGLGVLRPELAVLGEVKISGDFDLAEQGGVYAVRRLVAGLATAQPVATVTALQRFEFNPASGELRPTDATRDLVGIAVHQLPLAWANPLPGAFAFAGGTLRGEFTGLARGGGVRVRATKPVTIEGATLTRGPQRWLEGVDLSFEPAVDYNPQGWQAEIGGLTARKGSALWLSLDARVGQLKGKDEALKTAGRLQADLPGLLAQPFAAGFTALAAGEAGVEFAASLGKTQEVYAKVELRNLQGTVEDKVGAWPALAAEVRLDLEADGKVMFRVPLLIDAGSRQSDFSVEGTVVPGRGRWGRIEAVVSGGQVVVDDVQILAAAFAPIGGRPQPEAGTTPAPASAAAPWAGIEGSVTLRLGQVVYGETLRAGQVSGRLELEAGKLRLEGGQAGLGEKGRASLSAALAYDGSRPQPFGLDATLALKEFDPGPLLRSAQGGLPPVEGSFDVSSHVTSRAAAFGDLAAGVAGEFQLSSKGGIFRGLPVSVHPTVASTGRVAGFIAAAGNALGGLTGRKEPATIAGRAQAVAEFSAGLNAIAYDQLSLVFVREADRNGALRDFALIAPELRLTGSGVVRHRPGANVAEDALTMEFKLRARGRQGDLLRHLGVLDSVSDELGYAASSLPLRIGGTVGRPDASDVSTRLAALALEKAGVADKAGEFFNKIIGAGK